MDEESVETITPKITPEGIAGVWLAKHVSGADRNMQVSLGNVIEAMLAEGIRQGKRDAMLKLELTPTISAAAASLKADIIEIERAIDKKHVEGIEYDVFSL